MHSPRYGCLHRLAAKTNGRCHLCHKRLDIANYGPGGAFGRATVTVDRLWPQAFGGDDHADNLLLAHGGCNSARGLRDVEDVRLELAGTERAPASASEAFTAAVVGAVLAGCVGGSVLAQTTPAGGGFNRDAALLTGAAAFLLLLADA